MEHLLLKATITAATDEGTFTAVISTAAVDRDRDIVEPVAVVAALHKWAPTGKKVPLAWNHSVQAEDIIGNIDPVSAKAVGNEVVVDGWIDQSFERGQHAWRLVKSGTLGFSYGYLVTKADKRTGGGLHIKGMDIFEVTATPIPANGDTRVLGWKAAGVSQMADRMVAIADALVGDQAPDLEDMASRMRSMSEQMATLEKAIAKDVVIDDAQDKKSVDETDKEPPARSVDPLRKQAESVALEFASDGLSLRKPPRKVEQPKHEPELSLRDLKQRMRDEILTHLSGDITS